MKKRCAIQASKKENPEFEKFFKEHAVLNEETGEIKFKDCYAHLGLNVAWNGTLITMTYANAVWFLKTGSWPKPGYNIDHINDDSLDNRPLNLQEITAVENQLKRRGRIVYRSYGKGKYGYGIYIHHDKRDDRYYASRNMSRGLGQPNGQKYSLGGFDTFAEAEKVVKAHIEELKVKGLNYIPPTIVKKPKKSTLHLDVHYDKMREMRRQGMTYQAIADELGIRMGAVYKRTRDVVVD